MMSRQFHTQTLSQARYDEVWFEALFLVVDQLHDAASAGTLNTSTLLTPADMIGWLEDIIYTAQETITELQGQPTGKNVTGAELFS